ncbi:MAG: hypothetical protein Q7I92_15555 [Humidesulfovibrio sp.]|nr:hypothetical protein [Humidesulfovibrio sp.]
MPYDIRLVKLINGESVIGKWSDDGKTITDPAVLQTVPSQQGVQMMLLPFGYPFEQEITGEISTVHVLYEYKKAPEELKTKYLEASSNLTLSAPGGGNISQLLKK